MNMGARRLHPAVPARVTADETKGPRRLLGEGQNRKHRSEKITAGEQRGLSEKWPSGPDASPIRYREHGQVTCAASAVAEEAQNTARPAIAKVEGSGSASLCREAAPT